MHNCGNCNVECTDTAPGTLVVDQGIELATSHVTSICKKCTDGVKVLKIVLRRGANGRFQYDQYSAIEMQTKAAGKAR